MSAVADLGDLEGLAKYEKDPKTGSERFVFNDGNVSFGSDSPGPSGSWTSGTPVNAFLLKQKTSVYYWIFKDGTKGEETYSTSLNAVSHFTFCKSVPDECTAATLGEDQIDEGARTLSNTITDDDRVAKFAFTTLDNFTVVDNFDEGYSASDSDGDGKNDTWTWDGAGDPPTSVEFTLEAGDGSTSTYFLEVTNECGTTTTFDPAYEFGPAATEARLAGNAPNPFSGQTTVEFALAEQSRVTVAVYDMMGRKVATLVDEVRPAGSHAVSWSGQSDSGEDLASGVYLLRMQAGDQSQTRRMTIIH